MKRVTLIATAVAVAVFAVLATSVLAQETNTRERSFITFSNTVELPGVTLPAGTYVFRLADTPTRNVVQVLSQDEKDVLGQWLFVQAERPDVTGDTVVMFKETAENTTPAIQYWYFPGEKIGKEFVYPKAQAEKIAARTGQKVRTDQGYVTPEEANAQANPQPSSTTASNAATTERNAPAAAQPSAAAGSLTGNRGTEAQPQSTVAEHQAAPAPSQSVGTSGATAQNNQAVGTTGANAQSGNDSAAQRAETLPKTASGLPFIGLIGLLSLAGAFGVRRLAAVYNE
jgi:hypothetical protein